MICVNDVTSVGSCVEVLFSNVKPSLSCQGYLWMPHIHSNGWSIGFEHSEMIQIVWSV